MSWTEYHSKQLLLSELYSINYTSNLPLSISGISKVKNSGIYNNKTTIQDNDFTHPRPEPLHP